MATAQLTAPPIEKRLTPDEFMCVPIKRAELIDGVVVELPHRMFGNSVLVVTIGVFLHEFIEQNELGKLAAGGCFLTGPNNVRMPAISFLSKRDLSGEHTNQIIRKAPTLAIEILAKNDALNYYDDKADEFLRAGAQAVWIVNPRRRTVAVHTPDNIAVTYNVGDIIPGGEILPDLELPVSAIFRD